MSDILRLVGKRIRDIRKQKGLSQEQLGEKAGVHFSYIGGVERAEKNISLINLEKIAEALEVSVYELFYYAKAQIDFRTEKDSEVQQIFTLLLNQNEANIRKARKLLEQIFSDDLQ